MIRIDEKYVKNLNDILEKIDYIYILKNIRGIWDFTDPWFDFDDMLSVLEYLKIPNKIIVYGNSSKFIRVEQRTWKEIYRYYD